MRDCAREAIIRLNEGRESRLRCMYLDVKGIVTTKALLTEEKKYRIINRSQTDRTLLIEHANRTNQQFKLVGTDKPVEDRLHAAHEIARLTEAEAAIKLAP